MSAGLVLTNVGSAEIEAAYQAGETVKITLCSFGDGGGSAVTVDPSATTLKGRFGQVPLSASEPFDGMIGGTAIIPCADYPGRVVREFGLESDSGTLIAYGAYPDTYLPSQSDSIVKELIVRFVMPLVHAENVTLIVDPNIAIVTQEEGDKRYYRRSLRLQEVQDEGTEAQQELRENIGCGTSATKDVVTSPTDTTAGRVLTVGAGGLLGGPRDTTIANELFASFWRDTSIVKSGITIPYDGSPTINYFAVDGANHHAYIGRKAGANPISWVKIFSEFNKPTAADTGAVAKAGDTMTGKLTMNVDGEAIRLKPKTAGAGSYIISQDSVGANHWYVGAGSANNNDVQLVNYKAANNMVQLKADGSVLIAPTNGKNTDVIGKLKTAGEVQSTSADSFRIAYGNYGTFWRNDGNNLYLMLTRSGDSLGPYNSLRPFAVNLATGDITINKLALVNYANFDARYYTQSAANAKFITSVRHGTEGSQGTHDNLATSKAPSGCVLTGIKSNYNDGNWEVDTIYFRPEQVQLNGNWINTGYSTALLTTPAHIKSLPKSGVSSLLNLRPCLSEAVTDNDGNIIIPDTADYVDGNGYLWSVASRALAGSIFIGVDDGGVIRQIDADATMLRPDGLSVYGLDALPDGCTIDGEWIFDGGAVIPAPVDYVAEAEKLKAQLMSRAEAVIAPLQRAVKYSLATDAEKQLLEEWEVYTVLLSRVDTSQAPDIEWPPVPA